MRDGAKKWRFITFLYCSFGRFKSTLF